MAKTVIRPAGEQDVPAIIALYRELDSALVALQPEFFCEAPREEEEIRKVIRADDADFLLAERDGAVVGFALAAYAGWTPAYSCVLPHRYARLEDLVVGKAYRGQGIGGELLAAAKRWARNRRLEYIELNVLAQNESAVKLYESQDFVEATKIMRCML
ncbi:N-acetyltransferase family protein [Gemmiger sp.]